MSCFNAVNVTKHGISNFGRNNFKFSKTVAYITYIVFQCSLSQGYVTLNRLLSLSFSRNALPVVTRDAIWPPRSILTADRSISYWKDSKKVASSFCSV